MASSDSSSGKPAVPLLSEPGFFACVVPVMNLWLGRRGEASYHWVRHVRPALLRNYGLGILSDSEKDIVYDLQASIPPRALLVRAAALVGLKLEAGGADIKFGGAFPVKPQHLAGVEPRYTALHPPCSAKLTLTRGLPWPGVLHRYKHRAYAYLFKADALRHHNETRAALATYDAGLCVKPSCETLARNLAATLYASTASACPALLQQQQQQLHHLLANAVLGLAIHTTGSRKLLAWQAWKSEAWAPYWAPQAMDVALALARLVGASLLQWACSKRRLQVCVTNRGL